MAVAKQRRQPKPAENGASASKQVDEPVFQPITLQRLADETVEVTVVGLTPVIPHRWSAKARQMMLAKQQGKPTPKRQPKDPEKEAFEATYWVKDGRVGIPATAFKAAIVDASRFYQGVTFEMLKRVIFVAGEGPDQLVPLDGVPEMFEAMPRNSGAGRTADLRYRNMVFPWQATLSVNFLKDMLTLDTLIALVDAAGRCGVGDWRPSSPQSKTGTYGTWRVMED